MYIRHKQKVALRKYGQFLRFSHLLPVESSNGNKKYLRSKLRPWVSFCTLNGINPTSIRFCRNFQDFIVYSSELTSKFTNFDVFWWKSPEIGRKLSESFANFDRSEYWSDSCLSTCKMKLIVSTLISNNFCCHTFSTLIFVCNWCKVCPKSSCGFSSTTDWIF